jgi:hypothetical protein
MAMPRSRVALLGWIVAIAFILGTGLTYIDRLNLVATPPDLPNANLVERVLGSADYKQAIWPIFMWTNLAFAVGFIAVVAFAASVATAWGGQPTFRSLATTGGTIAAIASIIPIGAVNAAVWQLYCDCGFKETEIVSQIWAQMVALDIATWFNRVASVVLAVGLIVLARDAGERISATLRTWSYLLAIALVVAPLLGVIERTDPIAEELLTAVAGAILVPVWAVWLGRSVEATAS